MTGPIEHDLNLHAFNDWPFQFQIVDDNAAPVVLTSATWVLKRSAEAFEITRKSGVLADQTQQPGILSVTITQSETAALSGSFYYELQCLAGGVTRTTNYGTITILPTGIRN